MDTVALDNFNKRIDLNTDLKNISLEICRRYELGDFISNELIEVGYEDYNYYLTTSKEKYCVKIFNKARTKEEINDYLERIKAVTNSSISTPKPLLINGDIKLSLEYQENNYEICVFEYIDGKNFFELQEKTSVDTIKELAKQTAMINNLDIKPNYIYDSWAILNFPQEYFKKKEYISLEYREKFDKLVEELNNINFESLPESFVHGDIIRTNVIKDRKSKIWIIDFAVSNYLPRIIDLAVIACSMCLDKDSKDKTYDNISLLLREYQKYNKLTEYELKTFIVFYKIAAAMRILQTQYLIKIFGDTKENQYLLDEGMFGISFSEYFDFKNKKKGWNL